MSMAAWRCCTRGATSRTCAFARAAAIPVFAGDMAHFGVGVETPSLTRFAIAIRRRGEEPVYADVLPA
jgi:hypothetical protein